MKARHDFDFRLRVPLVLVMPLLATALCGAAAGAWRAVGPPGGRIGEVSIDPVRPSTIYVTVDGGVWKSVDRGVSWSGMNEGLRGLAIGDVSVDPDGVLYAGSGRGAFKSTDGGRRWLPISSGLETDLGPIPIGRIVIDASSASTLYATSGVGLFRSLDAGGSWTFVGPRQDSAVRDVVVSPESSSTLYIATVGGGVSRSTDGGESWTLVLDPTEFGAVPIILNLEMDPFDPRTFYAAGSVIFKSEDGGDSWRPLLDAAASPRLVNDLAIAASDPSLLLAATATGLYRSESRGVDWAFVDAGLPVIVFLGEEDRQLTDVAIDPLDSHSAYVASFDGLYATRDGGATWDQVPRLSTRAITALAVSDGRSGRVLAGTFDIPGGGVFVSDDGGGSWSRHVDGLPLPTLVALASAPGDPLLFYAATLGTNDDNGGVYRSTDGGETWEERSGGLRGALERNVADLTVDPRDLATLFLGNVEGVYRTADGGENWTDFNDPVLEQALVDAPQAVVAQVALVAEEESLFAAVPDVGVFRSPLDGPSWTDVSAGLGDLDLAALAPDPHAAGAVWAVSRTGEVSRFTGDGPWERRGEVGASAPASHALVDPGKPDSLYVATDGDAVYRSRDGGRTWERFADGLSFPAVLRLAADGSEPPVVYAGTRGGGVFAWRDEESLPPNACLDDVSAMCLSDRRFRVTLQWRAGSGASGEGKRVGGGSSDSGLFWFFDPDNWEVLVKVLDACGVDGHFWVFAAVATDVEYTLRVEDQTTAVVREYAHALGSPATSIIDTAAFACP